MASNKYPSSIFLGAAQTGLLQAPDHQLALCAATATFHVAVCAATAHCWGGLGELGTIGCGFGWLLRLQHSLVGMWLHQYITGKELCYCIVVVSLLRTIARMLFHQRCRWLPGGGQPGWHTPPGPQPDPAGPLGAQAGCWLAFSWFGEPGNEVLTTLHHHSSAWRPVPGGSS
ncbi:hypothetical protein COO60DRAFT_470270 [Scenedesmus sp. NREL 46B-D3]|nr:hypothetical protein COO60DRAFT_470270 [Scenedesmus sp. NREL 46B-D3]